MKYLARFSVAVIIAALGLVVSFLWQSTNDGSEFGRLDLTSPGFVRVAQAYQQSIGDMLSDEAGISAYIQTSGPIDLTKARGVFRTIEADTEQILVGSVPIANYPEKYDVHVLMNAEGWIVAYYLKSDPVAKIVDWELYKTSKSTIPTKLETVLSNVTTAAGVSYEQPLFYDFRYPNATHLLLIAEEGIDDTFTVELPPSFTYYELSWSSSGNYCDRWLLNGENVAGSCRDSQAEGTIPASKMPTGQEHTIISGEYSGLAVVYKEQ